MTKNEGETRKKEASRVQEKEPQCVIYKELATLPRHACSLPL